ncbi:hypothetical protein U9M48_038842 [Paspalum notatum var. saurae]|uniref:Uncharacterized protein n=1 Tax=Paspalum notatum var. saurae TaxID=547442 RepID=A0AAQ3UIB3_PASNO
MTQSSSPPPCSSMSAAAGPSWPPLLLPFPPLGSLKSKQQVLEELPSPPPFTTVVVGHGEAKPAAGSAGASRRRPSMAGLDWVRSQFTVLLALSNPSRSCSAKNSRATPTESRIRRSRTPCAVWILLCRSVRNGRFRGAAAPWPASPSTTASGGAAAGACRGAEPAVVNGCWSTASKVSWWWNMSAGKICPPYPSQDDIAVAGMRKAAAAAVGFQKAFENCRKASSAWSQATEVAICH